MSDSFETHASDIRGGMHTGSGDINNNTSNYYLQTDSPGVSPRKQPADDLRWIQQRFVAPAGLGKARDVLEASRTVFLDGLPGSGRIAAAKMLLWELEDGGRQIHELLLQEKENAPRIDHSHVGDGDLVWLDLSQVTGARWDEVHDELPSLRATVRDRDAHLVVVLPDKAGHLDSTLIQYRVGIQRPAVDEVLSHYLRVEDLPRPVPLPRLRFLDADRRMDEVPQYVELIRRARDEHRDDGFMIWCEAAYRALSGQAQDVAAQVAELSAGQRALLLAVAMLHGAHADVIHRADADLLNAVAHPCEDGPLLERAPLDQRLKEIGARIDSSGSVRFEELDYDAAIRSYFWAHMPELRDALQDWVKQTADSLGLSAQERTNLVERFTEQCLTERYRPALVSLVEQWTAHPTTIRKMEAAALVVRRGLRDEQQGRSFRRQIYYWSLKDDLSERLAEVIIVACRDEMMAKYPDESLVRLHHVARRERGTLARETLIELVSGGAPRLRRQMLTRLTNSPGKWRRDVDLFLEFADPEALTDPGRRDRSLVAEDTVRRQLATGWSLAYTRHPYEVWAPRVRRWLHVAAVDERHRHALLDVLIHGGAEDTSVLARLYAMTRERQAWVPLGDLVVQGINTVWEARIA